VTKEDTSSLTENQIWLLFGILLGAYPLIIGMIDQFLLGGFLATQFDCLFGFHTNSTGIGVCN
jgi:hypothetical protein